MLEIRDLHITYGANRAVRNVGFAVEEETVFSLLGANGAGKSSILRAVSGLVRPSDGDILLRGESIVRLKPAAIVNRGVAHVPEARRVFPEMTVLDNLLVGATRLGGDRRRTSETLERVYEVFPILRDRAKQRGGTMSGGEQQQLVIGRGLMADPKLLLLDEPTLGLAPAIIENLMEVIGRLREFGLTVLLSEQNADFALEVADEGAVLTSGELTLRGDAASLRQSDEVKQAYLGA